MGCQCSKHEKLYEERIDGDCFVDLIKRQIADYPVLLYSRTICPSSSKVKQLLRKHGIQFEYFELDNMSTIYIDEDANILRALHIITSKRAAPFVFMNGKYVGGYEGNLYSEVEQILSNGKVENGHLSTAASIKSD